MKFGCITFSICLSVLSLASASGNPLAQNGAFPDIILSAPKSPVHQSYLGVTGKSTFKIPEMKPGVVIIEIFSMYCPHCQREAPGINKLYYKLQRDPILKDKVRFIGIGAGNSDLEVGVFKKKYKVPFPLFSDNDLSIHKKIGEVRTPYFICVKISKDGSHKIFYSEIGAISGSKQFWDMIRGQVTSE